MGPWSSGLSVVSLYICMHTAQYGKICWQFYNITIVLAVFWYPCSTLKFSQVDVTLIMKEMCKHSQTFHKCFGRCLLWAPAGLFMSHCYSLLMLEIGIATVCSCWKLALLQSAHAGDRHCYSLLVLFPFLYCGGSCQNLMMVHCNGKFWLASNCVVLWGYLNNPLVVVFFNGTWIQIWSHSPHQILCMTFKTLNDLL